MSHRKMQRKELTVIRSINLIDIFRRAKSKTNSILFSSELGTKQELKMFLNCDYQ